MSSHRVLLRDRFSSARIRRVLVPFLALLAVVVGLLTVHSLRDAPVHAGSVEAASTAAGHEHRSADGSAQAELVQLTDSGALPAAPCHDGEPLDCCVPLAACAIVLALLSVSLALGGNPILLGIGLVLVQAGRILNAGLVPVRPRTLAQLSTFRI
jgi:hypothetical protein